MYRGAGSYFEESSQIGYTKFDEMFNENEDKRHLMGDSNLDEVKLNSIDCSKNSEVFSKHNAPIFNQFKNTKNFMSFKDSRMVLHSSPGVINFMSKGSLRKGSGEKKNNIKSGFRSKSVKSIISSRKIKRSI